MALGHWLKDYIGPKGSENSGGGTPLIVTVTNGTLDKTWQEIYDALSAPSVVIVPSVSADEVNQGVVASVYHDTEEDEYSVVVGTIGSSAREYYIATSADGYPVLQTS